jgi:hypothetical protein
MQSPVFDSFARDLGEVSTRRGFVRLLGGLTLAGGLNRLGEEKAEAKGKKAAPKKKKKKDRQPPPDVDHLPPPPPPDPPCYDTPQTCPAGQTRCPAGGANCFSGCLDLQNNPEHCGMCGVTCPKDPEMPSRNFVCQGGQCICTGTICGNGRCCPASHKECVRDGTACCATGYPVSCPNGRCCPAGHTCGGTCGKECCKA